MLEKLYDLFVWVVSFVLGLFGFELNKRSVTFAEGTKGGEAAKEEAPQSEEKKEENVTSA
jgi:hypothetical protein